MMYRSAMPTFHRRVLLEGCAEQGAAEIAGLSRTNITSTMSDVASNALTINRKRDFSPRPAASKKSTLASSDRMPLVGGST
jgi:hypothetical protein